MIRRIMNKKLRISFIFISILVIFAVMSGMVQTTLANSDEVYSGGEIGGLVWNDVNNDGLRTEDEQPVAGYIIYLYSASDLSNVKAVEQTDENGEYTFREIETGSYVLGIINQTVNGVDFSLPEQITADNSFESDDGNLLVAYTNPIELESGQIVKNVNAGLQIISEQEMDFASDDLSETDENIEENLQPEGEPQKDANLFSEEEQGPSRAPAEEFEDGYTIDLSKTTSMSGPGYTVTGGSKAYEYPNNQFPAVPNNTLTFDTGANGGTYYIIQTGLYKPAAGPGPDPSEPKKDSSIFGDIIITTNVDVTLVTDEIDLPFSIIIEGTGKLVLKLSNKNIIRGSITVNTGAELTIESYNGSNSSDKLSMPAVSGRTSTRAKIGGDSNNSAGKIIINGGTIDMTVRSTGAGIGGGGTTNMLNSDPGSAGGNGGIIIINDGIISVTQYGVPVNANAYDIAGAGIGGGGGNNSNGGSGGNISITGGSVTVRQYTRAAGIGGGTFGSGGNITITGGNIDSEVILYRPGHSGSAIGGSCGANSGGASSVLITGGTVRAVSDATGIGIVHGNEDPFIIRITGGTIFAKGVNGAGIGCWGAKRETVIRIEGGTIIAQSDKNAGIGGIEDNEPPIYLAADANVKAYSGGTIPAMNVQNNSGNGYFVNARFEPSAISGTTAVTLTVIGESDGLFKKTLNLPAGYRNFAYSSDISESRIDNIFAGIGTSLRKVIRVIDDNWQIYSIINRNGYNSHNTNNPNKGFLPVKLDNQTAYHEITEKYVDIYGMPIEGKIDGKTIVASGENYSKTLPVIPEYIGKGHKWNEAPDSGGSDYLTGSPETLNVIQGMTVYLVYKLDPGIANLQVSKTVVGHFINKTKEFTFTILYLDDLSYKLSQGTMFAYTGGTVPGMGASAPSDGILTIDGDGKAVFTLKHGQSITIHNVPADTMIRIEETTEINYSPMFTDSEGPAGTCDTGYRVIGSSGGTRTFEFFNTQIADPVPTGIRNNLFMEKALPAIAALLGVVVWLFMMMVKKRLERNIAL